jgi:hypothetical protein
MINIPMNYSKQWDIARENMQENLFPKLEINTRSILKPDMM